MMQYSLMSKNTPQPLHTLTTGLLNFFDKIFEILFCSFFSTFMVKNRQIFTENFETFTHTLTTFKAPPYVDIFF